MWLIRLGLLGIGVFVQLLIVADILNHIALGTLDGDTVWGEVFLPAIISLVVMGCFVLAACSQATRVCTAPDDASGPREPQLIEAIDEQGNVVQMSSTNELLVSSQARTVPGQVYGGPARLVEGNERLAVARVYFFNALIDTVVLVCLAVFVGLLIDQLNRLYDDVEDNEMSWVGVFAPLLVLIGVLLLVFFFAALRVCAEERYQRPLGNGEYIGAACGGVVVCCAVREKELNNADMLRQDKRALYTANDGFHELPCVFCCTPSMSFGWVDVLLGVDILVFFLVLFIALVQVARRLNGTIATPLNTIFIGLYIVEGLAIFFSLGVLFMLCAFWRTSKTRPRGRATLMPKYIEALVIIITSIALIVQQALLAHRIDGVVEQEADWFFVFIPAFSLSVFFLLAACFETSCFAGRATSGKRATVVVVGSNPPSFIQLRQAQSAWGALQ